VPALPLEPVPPRWVSDWLASDGDHERPVARTSPGGVTSTGAGTFTLFSAGIEQAEGLAGQAFSDAVARAYTHLLDELNRQRREPLHIWNFIPGIQAILDNGQDRYMAFNAGRFAAYSSWLGTSDQFAGKLPTASAMGISGDELRIHVLGGISAGTAVENPRQRPPHEYPPRYGVRPPLFSRAVICPSMSSVLIGGTASIVGAESRHAGDVRAQLREALSNVAAVIERATGCSTDRALGLLRDVRIHIRDAADADVVRDLWAKEALHAQRVEFVQAALCRRELLVEVEGLAALA